MKDWQSLAHVKWECKYHIIWVPKYRCKVLYGKVRRRAGKIIRELCLLRDLRIIEGHAMLDHIHYVHKKYSSQVQCGERNGDFDWSVILGTVFHLRWDIKSLC